MFSYLSTVVRFPSLFVLKLLLLAFLHSVRWTEFSHLLCYKNQGSTGTCHVHSWHQTSCIQHNHFPLRSPPCLLVACCYYLKSGDESFLSQAKIRHWDLRSHAYNRFSWGWSQRNRQFFSGIPSILHQLLFGRRRHQKLTGCQVWWRTHHLFFGLI